MRDSIAGLPNVHTGVDGLRLSANGGGSMTKKINECNSRISIRVTAERELKEKRFVLQQIRETGSISCRELSRRFHADFHKGKASRGASDSHLHRVLMSPEFSIISENRRRRGRPQIVVVETEKAEGIDTK